MIRRLTLMKKNLFSTNTAYKAELLELKNSCDSAPQALPFRAVWA